MRERKGQEWGRVSVKVLGRERNKRTLLKMDDRVIDPFQRVKLD